MPSARSRTGRARAPPPFRSLHSGRVMKRKTVVAAALAVSAVLILAAVAWTLFGPNPNALWQIVSEQCVPQARDGAAHNRCAKVDLAAGYAVFKDRNGIGQ